MKAKVSKGKGRSSPSKRTTISASILDDTSVKFAAGVIKTLSKKQQDMVAEMKNAKSKNEDYINSLRRKKDAQND